MKLCYCYTKSHEELAEKYFKPSIKNQFTIKERKLGGEPKIVKYGTKDFIDGILHKLDLIIESIEEGEPFIFSDVDVIFFKSIPEQFDKDILFQDTYNNKKYPCTGFFTCNPNNNEVLKLWKDIRTRVAIRKRKNNKNFTCDQSWLQRIIKWYDIDWGFLPPQYTTGCVWNPPKKKYGYSFDKSEAILWHATCINGTENKIKCISNLI